MGYTENMRLLFVVITMIVIGTVSIVRVGVIDMHAILTTAVILVPAVIVMGYLGQKIGEIIDPEIGLTTWYSRDGKRVEFNDKGIAAFDEDGRLSDLFDFSNVIWKRVEFDFLNTVYQRLFGKNPKEKQKSANNQ